MGNKPFLGIFNGEGIEFMDSGIINIAPANQMKNR